MSRADEDAIRDLENQFNAAWDRHDPEALAESLTNDAQFITVNGAWTTTRNGFRDLMARLHGASGPFRTSTRHQIAKAVARRGPGAVDGDELGVVGERLGHALGVVPVPRGVEL